MSEIFDDGNKKEIVKAIVSPASTKMGEALAPAGQEIGQTAAGLLHIAVSPFKALIWGFQQVEDILIPIVQKKIDKIKEADRKNPDPNIVGATLEASKFHLSSEELTDMFASLIASSADKNLSPYTHPAFVNIIQQLSPLDAKCCNFLWNKYGSFYPDSFGDFPIITTITESEKFGQWVSIRNLSEIIFMDEIKELSNADKVSTQVMDNLERLGILKTSYDGILRKGEKDMNINKKENINDGSYKELLHHPNIVRMANYVCSQGHKQLVKLGYARFTMFGQNFMRSVESSK